MPQPTPLPRAVLLRRYLDNMIARVSDANRPFVTASAMHRLNKGLRASSVVTYVSVLCQADRTFAAPFASITPGQLVGFITHLRATKAEKTVAGNAMFLRTAWRELLDVDILPRDVARALTVREPKRAISGRVLSTDEFETLLTAVAAAPNGRTRIARAPMRVAVVWTLLDSGFRARELISLNIGDVKIDGPRGATLALRPDAPDLKTGPRSIYVSECVPALHVWMKLHPAGNDPRAPLFVGTMDKTGQRRLDYQELHKLVVRASRAAGVSNTHAFPGNISPHDFRHTCATRKARLGWNEAKLRAYFGWSGGSSMPSLYVHLVLGDLKEQILKDAGVDSRGYQLQQPGAPPLIPQPTRPTDEQALVTALARILAKAAASNEESDTRVRTG